MKQYDLDIYKTIFERLSSATDIIAKVWMQPGYKYYGIDFDSFFITFNYEYYCHGDMDYDSFCFDLTKERDTKAFIMLINGDYEGFESALREWKAEVEEANRRYAERQKELARIEAEEKEKKKLLDRRAWYEKLKKEFEGS